MKYPVPQVFVLIEFDGLIKSNSELQRFLLGRAQKLAFIYTIGGVPLLKLAVQFFLVAYVEHFLQRLLSTRL